MKSSPSASFTLLASVSSFCSLHYLLLAETATACGDFHVDFACTHSPTGQPCHALPLRPEPAWPCSGGGSGSGSSGRGEKDACVQRAYLQYTGTPCRGRNGIDQESAVVRACHFSVFSEDCERFDDNGGRNPDRNDYVTDCLEHLPQQVWLTATSSNDADKVLFRGAVAIGDTVALQVNDDDTDAACLPADILLEAVELPGSYQVTGVDFRHRLELYVASSSSSPYLVSIRPGMEWGAFRLLRTTCQTKSPQQQQQQQQPPPGRRSQESEPPDVFDLDSFLASTASVLVEPNHDDDCLTLVDLQFCISTDSEAPLPLRFEEVEHNLASILTHDFDLLVDEPVILQDRDGSQTPSWCRTLTQVPFDVCRRQHVWVYEFGIYNDDCPKTTVRSKFKFDLTEKADE